jgi:DNA invertase Pin-like site-specific DNA recombinase
MPHTKKPNQQPRVGIYARVSTRDQKCRQQIREVRAYVQARGWKIAGEYIDWAQSGKKTTRPEMDRLMADARQRKVDAIVVNKIDRWGRSMIHFVSSVQELHALGVRFLATSQGIDTDESNPTGRLLMNILACFAEFERELISERTIAGLVEARKKGHFGGRPAVAFDMAEARRLRRRGQSLREIARAMGVSPATVLHRLRSSVGKL